MVLPDAQPGQVPLVVVDVDDLGFVVLTVLRADAVFELLADVHQRLDHPDEPDLVGLAPCVGGEVDHLTVERDVFVPPLHGDQLEGNVGRLLPVRQVHHRDPVVLQHVLGRQVVQVARHSDLQHGDHLEVAQAVDVGVGGGVQIVERGPVLVLYLPLLIPFGPVEDVVGVPEMIGVGGPELELHVGDVAGVQVVHDQGEGVVFGEGVGVLGGGVGGQVQVVGHPVAVVVVVQHVGRAVAVGVVGDAVAVLIHEPLLPVGEPVVVGVHLQRVGVPDPPGVEEALDLQRVGDEVPIGVDDIGVGAEELLLVVGEAVPVGILPGLLEKGSRVPEGEQRVGVVVVGVGAEEDLLDVGEAVVVGVLAGVGLDHLQGGRAAGGEGIRLGEEVLHPLAQVVLRGCFLLLAGAFRLAAGELRCPRALEKRRDHQRGDDHQRQCGVHLAHVAVGDEEEEPGEGEEEEGDLVEKSACGAGQRRDRCGQPPGYGAEVGEVHRHLRRDLLVVPVRKLEVEDLADGQSVGADPQFALTGHLKERLGQVQFRPGREFPFLQQALLKLVAQVGGEGRTVDAEGVAGEGDPGAGLRLVLGDVLGSDEIGHEVPFGGEEGGEVLGFLPRLVGPADQGAVPFDPYLDAGAGVEDVAPLGPEDEVEGSGPQVRLALQMQSIPARGPSDVGDGGERGGGLDDVGGEAVGAGLADAFPGGLKAVGPRGRDHRGVEDQRQREADQGTDHPGGRTGPPHYVPPRRLRIGQLGFRGADLCSDDPCQVAHR